MRPINLIPQDERRAGGIARTGPLAYIIVGALGVLLIGVVLLVLTSNEISDRESEVSGLEASKVAATAEAERLTPYASFQTLTEQRTQTISQLADSRFDWPRVIREMSLILPPQVYFDNLTASAGGGAGVEGESVSISSPSLKLEGCAPHQWIVAGFIASLKDIDGVTRIGLKESKLAASSGAEGGSICSGSGIYNFQIVVAFDGAPSSPDGAEAIAASSAESAETAAEGTEEAASGEAESSEGEESSEAAPETPEAPPAEETASSAPTTEPVG